MSEPATAPDTGDHETHDGTDARQGATDPAGPDRFTVVDAPEASRWEVREGDRVVGVAQYVVLPQPDGAPDRVVFFHTEVRPEAEGHGLASRLVRAALDATIAGGGTVVALCPYVTAWVQRHPDPYARHTVRPVAADVEAAERAG